MLNLDTHILLKSLEGLLTRYERTVLTENPTWGISAIVLREIAKLHQLGRIRYGLDHEDATRIGYEISVTCYFYKPQPLRTLEEIRADILALEREAEAELEELFAGSAK